MFNSSPSSKLFLTVRNISKDKYYVLQLYSMAPEGTLTIKAEIESFVITGVTGKMIVRCCGEQIEQSVTVDVNIPVI